MAIREHHHHESAIDVYIFALPHLQLCDRLTDGVQQSSGTIRFIIPAIKHLRVRRPNHRADQIDPVVKKCKPNPNILIREFRLHPADPSDLLIESVDGSIDAVIHGSAAIHDEMINSALPVHVPRF